MSTDSTKVVVQRLYDEVFSRGNLDAADDLVAADAFDHSPVLFSGQAERGPERVKQHARWFRNAFPDAAWSLDDMLAERDKVVLRATFRGTHQGEFLGLPATGKPVKMMELRAFRIEDGKVAELWGRAETFGLRHQLGEAPQLGPREGSP